MTPPSSDPAVEAYLWAYPLVVMHRTRALLCSVAELGVMDHRDQLASPSNRAVVAPNNDTLYSSGWFDLSHGDLVVDAPPMDHSERYWNVMILDAYTHVAYACRRLHGVDGTTVRVTLDPAVEAAPGGATVIPVATPTVWVLVRVLVDGDADLDAARALQRGITVQAPQGHPRGHTARTGRPNLVHEAGAAFFAEARAALAIDPPAAWHPRPSDVAQQIIHGTRELDDAALLAAVQAGEDLLRDRGLGSDVVGNGWGARRRGADFGEDTLARAVYAKFALAGHHPAENRAYIALHDSDGRRLDGSRALRCHFGPGDLPPCDGFWSLTAYGPDMYLVENEIDRWSIGDRTRGLVRDNDGGLTVQIGGPRPDDTSNWLPAPDGPYGLGLRVYEGHPQVVDCTWFPPPLLT